MQSNEKLRWTYAILIVSLMAFDFTAGRLVGPTPAIAQDSPPPAPDQEQPEAMTRGPVHESFAEPIVAQTQVNISTAVAPPESINESPPDERPQGNNVAWVPGYWAWDAERNGYIWVSGCWRVAPPQMSWVSGYWAHETDRWEWVPGFWTPVGNQEIEYLPPPPDMDDMAPPGEPAGPNTVWVPPCYYRVEGRYTLRHGYWLTSQSGWVWTPSHYIRTPRGHIFIAGHWDYELRHRGVLFAPVAFSAGFHSHAAFSYSPSIVINGDLLTANLFVYPRYCHYYFGDYYDDGYIKTGIYPWFEVQKTHQWCDPIFDQERSQHRDRDNNWDQTVRRDYDDRRAHVEQRPARTYREQEVRVARAPEPQRHNIEIAQPLARVIVNTSVTVKFEHVNTESKANYQRQTTDANKFRDERVQWESKKGSKSADNADHVAIPVQHQDKPTPTDHREAAPQHQDKPASVDHRDAAPQHQDNAAPADHRDAAPQHQDKPAPADHRDPAPQRPENPAPADHRDAAPQHQDKPAPADHRDAVPPHQDQTAPKEKQDKPAQPSAPSQSDRVKIRPRPIADPPAPSGSPASHGNDKGPPPGAPSGENHHGDSPGPAKDPKASDNNPPGGGNDAQRGNGNDSSKGGGNQGGNNDGPKGNGNGNGHK